MSYLAESRLMSSPILKYDSVMDAQRKAFRVYQVKDESSNSEIIAGGAAMDVTGPSSGSLPINSIPPAQQTSSAPTNVQPISTTDEVEISSAKPMNNEINAGQNLRAARLEQIKQSIEAGTYETEDKLDAALNQLLSSVFDADTEETDSDFSE